MCVLLLRVFVNPFEVTLIVLVLFFDVSKIKKKNEGDMVAAKAFKRAAHIALSAIFKWVRKDGSLWIVKNRLDPSVRHGFEAYSFHSQYNLLAASMLATAWHIADESITEGPAPCEVGGFVFQLPFHHKIFANCSGMYIELDTGAEEKYDSTGLIRIHKTGVDPLVGPSDTSAIAVFPVAVGVGWLADDKWEYLAQFGENKVSCSHVFHEQTPELVHFEVTYKITDGPQYTTIIEEYEVRPDSVQVRTRTDPPVPKLKIRFPIFQSDGSTSSTFTVKGNKVAVSFSGSQQSFEVETSAVDLQITAQNIPFRNGFLSVAEAEVAGGHVSYVLRPLLDP